jgi:hypothetical protein
MYLYAEATTLYKIPPALNDTLLLVGLRAYDTSGIRGLTKLSVPAFETFAGHGIL